MKKSLIIKLIFIVMIIGLPIIIFLLRFNVSNANMDRYVVTEYIWRGCINNKWARRSK